MKNTVAVGKERSLGAILTKRERTPQEVEYRNYVDVSNLDAKDKMYAIMASQEFGIKELVNGLENEITDFIAFKIKVATDLVGGK